MIGLGALVLLALVVASAVAIARAASRSGPEPLGGRASTGGAAKATGPAASSVGVDAELARWVEAGLLSPEQAAAISEHERVLASLPPPPAPPSPARAGRVPVVVEALGYLGGTLVVAGLVVLVAQSWSDIATAGRLGLSAAISGALLGGGALVRESDDPALARFRGLLWLLSAGAAALFVGVLVADGLGVERDETVVLAGSATVALHSGLLWRGRPRPLQQLGVLAGSAVAVGALVAVLAGSSPVGPAVWAVGGLYLVAGLSRRIPTPLLAEAVGAVAVVVGASMSAEPWQGPGLVFLVATGLGLVGLALVPGLAPERSDQILLAIIGGLALLQGIPSTLGFFAHEAGGPTGLLVWLVGALLILLGARRLVRLPVVVEVAGGLAIVGGAALTGVQWPSFAPVLGIVTAVALIALGTLPGQVLLSVFGSVGLLVNVPWAIGRFFPGEGRAPLLIMVTGALIIGVAVLLGRSGGRFRRELGRGGSAPAEERRARTGT